MNPLQHTALKFKGGFTLVEMLIMVIIIAMLAILSLVALNASMETARSTVCMNNLHQGWEALALYAADNQGNLPPLAPADTQPLGLTWAGLIAPYLSNQPFGWSNGTTMMGLRCPDATPAPVGGFSACYGALYGVAPMPFVLSADKPGEVYSPVKLGTLNPALLLLADASNWVIYNYPVYVDTDNDGVPDSLVDAPGFVYNGMLARHHGHINIVCADGHVESLTPKQLFSDWNDYIRMH